MLIAEEWCPERVFNPAEEEIVGFYLKLAAMGMPLPPFAESAVRRVDVYGSQAPWEIFVEELARGSRVFFAITRLVKRSKGRMSRVVGGGGTWKGQSVKREINVGDVTAVRYTLSFMKETNDEQAAASSEKTKKKKKMASTHWNMVEYKVSSFSGEGDLDQNVVFCRLTYSGPRHQSSPVPSSASSSAVGGSKRAVDDNDGGLSNNTTEEPIQWSTTAQPAPAALELQEVENVDWTQINMKSNGEVIGSEDDGYLDIINFDVAMDDNDGGLSNNATEEKQQENPDHQSTITIAATISTSQADGATVGGGAPPAPAALGFQEEVDVDWAQILKHVGIFRPEVALDDDVDFSIFDALVQKKQQQ
uniref:NAC domain-containing protein n=1 Tax=Kalanchoe fedtschenkoi TaxID=63787 RepID=A0A7N0V3M3_KALFE